MLDPAALERLAVRGRRSTRTVPERGYTTERHGGSLKTLVIAVIVVWLVISVGMWLRAHPISWPTFEGGYHYAEPAPRGHFPEPLSYPHEWKQQP